MSVRLKAMGQERYRNGFRVTLHPDVVELPLRWAKPQMIFVNSMSDLFHRDVPVEFIRRVFAVIEAAPQHTFQILTKRSGRLASLSTQLPWPSNLWLGVTVEAQKYLARMDHLREVPAHVRFVSFEPLLGPMGNVRFEGVHWAIVGGESGPGARPMRAEWARGIRDQCIAQGVPFFFKQWGGTRRTAAGRRLDGDLWEEYPGPLSSTSAPASAVAAAVR